MELIPVAFIAGVFWAPNVQAANAPGVTRETLNRIWSEVTSDYPYQGLQLAPAGDGAQFLGPSENEGVTIQPPLIQVRDAIVFSTEQSAAKTQAILKIIARHLGSNQFYNFGLKLVYHAPVPVGDAQSFVLRQLVSANEDALAELHAGSPLWMGVKYMVNQQDGSVYTLTLEPLHANLKLLFIDLDAQFPGFATIESIAERAQDVSRYMDQSVRRYLETSSQH